MTLWVFSGEWSNSTVGAEEVTQQEKARLDGPSSPNSASGAPSNALVTKQSNTLVRAVQSKAETKTLFLDVRGQTAANRMVQVKAEVAGKVVTVAGKKGSVVKKGDPLCRVAEDARCSRRQTSCTWTKLPPLHCCNAVMLAGQSFNGVRLAGSAQNSVRRMHHCP